VTGSRRAVAQPSGLELRCRTVAESPVPWTVAAGADNRYNVRNGVGGGSVGRGRGGRVMRKHHCPSARNGLRSHPSTCGGLLVRPVFELLARQVESAARVGGDRGLLSGRLRATCRSRTPR